MKSYVNIENNERNEHCNQKHKTPHFLFILAPSNHFKGIKKERKCVKKIEQTNKKNEE